VPEAGVSGMRVEATADEDKFMVWLTDSETENLRRHATSRRDDIASEILTRPNFP